MNKFALYNIQYGVYVCSSFDNDRPTGCIVNSVMQITSDPITIAISVNHNNFTHECIEKTKKFAISVLGENSDPFIITNFGFNSGKTVNKFDSVDYKILDQMPIINDCVSYYTCEVISTLNTPTHTIFLAKVINAENVKEDVAMTYAYYHKVIKGKSPKNAPTYIQEEKKVDATKEQYICTVCGYIYDGEIPFEELPDDYTCPICGYPKSVFKKF